MKLFFLFGAIFINILGCQQSKTSEFNAKIEYKLNDNIYDSIQVFVDYNIKANNRSEIYLLEFINSQSDSVNFLLTTLLKKSINPQYKASSFFYNKDSSLLIVNSYNELIYKNITNKVENVKSLNFSNDTGNFIYDPLTWRLIIVGDKVFLDKYYGMQEAKKNVIIPKEKFNPN